MDGTDKAATRTPTEDELLAAIERLLSVDDPGVVVGVGDDAAVVRPGAGDLVLTTDALVEGTHFDVATTSARDLGYKAVAVNLSDVAAMGGSPRFALAAVSLRAGSGAAWVVELLGGMREACAEHAALLVGGNLARAPEVTLAVTLVGDVAPGRAVTRAGARPGDVVVVTGELGSAAAGRRLAAAPSGSWDEPDRDAIRRAHRPRARVGEGGLLAAHGATAMIDVSDGLARDLLRLCDASGVGVRLRLSDLPAGPRASDDEVLGGGEDYELLATLPPERVDGARAAVGETFAVALTPVGAIVAEGRVAVDAEGVERPLVPAGWDHFA
jgi:thiamine-monophosphate kinase